MCVGGGEGGKYGVVDSHTFSEAYDCVVIGLLWPTVTVLHGDLGAEGLAV